MYPIQAFAALRCLHFLLSSPSLFFSPVLASKDSPPLNKLLAPSLPYKMNIFRQLSANNVVIKPYPFPRELSMEAYLLDNESILKLDDDELNNSHIIDVQIPLKNGRASGDGRIDILAQYHADNVAIIELKLGEISSADLNQLEGYLKERNQLEEYIKNDPQLKQDVYKDLKENEPLKWIGVLAGTSITKELASELTVGKEMNVDEVKIPIAGITINRYRNVESSDIYVVTDTYFKIKSSSRDYSKYQFQGQSYGKGRLVQAIIADYVKKHSSITYSGLLDVFPKKLRGGDGCFETLEKAAQIYKEKNKKRHLLDEKDQIQLDSYYIVTSTEWTLKTVTRFIKHAKILGYTITKE